VYNGGTGKNMRDIYSFIHSLYKRDRHEGITFIQMKEWTRKKVGNKDGRERVGGKNGQSGKENGIWSGEV